MAPLQPGDSAPDICLPTPFDVEVELRPLLQAGPVVVEFIRGTWDPNARERLEELTDSKERLKPYRARSLVVSCEDAERARAYLETHASSKSTASLVVDTTREVAKAYRVFQRFSFGAFNIARPATFVVDRCGYVRYVHVGRSPIQTAPVEEILAVLEKVEGEATRESENS